MQNMKHICLQIMPLSTNQTNLVILFKMKYLDFYCVNTQVLAQKHYINKKKSLRPEKRNAMLLVQSAVLPYY
jgi:hypothetical protein